MNKGGDICNRLKFIRKRLAEQNGIDYKVERCPNSDNCKEGTCPFCEKEEYDLIELLLDKEERGEKVVWDVNLDDYDPSIMYGDAEFDKATISPIDSSVNLEKIELIPTTMGVLRDVIKIPDLNERQVDGMVDAPNPNKGVEFPDFKTVDVPWFEIDNKNENDSHNEKQDSSISSEKSILEEVPWMKDVLLETDYNKLSFEPLMGDVTISEEMKPITDVKLKAVDNWDLMVRTDTRELDEDNFDDTLHALKHIHQSTGSTFTDTLNAYLREGKDVEKAIEYLTTYGGYKKVAVQNDIPEEKSENAEPRSVLDDFVESKVIPITIEAIRAVHQATNEGMGYCKKILQKYGGRIDKAIEDIKKHPTRRVFMGSVKRDDIDEK